jgi:PBP1b-binding outer membrane lipoprotein LpoB
MIKKILVMAIVLTVLAISGCIENGAQMAENNTTDAPANVTGNVTANASGHVESQREHVESQSASIPLERPPFLEDE